MKRSGAARRFVPQGISGALPDHLIRRLLPAAVAVVEGPIPDPPAPLWPAEADLVSDAVAKRVREFAAGRAFAHRALGILGAPPGPLLAKPDRSPLWPPAFVGSITHVSDYCAVATARTADVLAIGIDVEDFQRFDPAFVEQIFSPAEIRLYVRGAAGEDLRRLGTLIFSAKEAIYKCLSVLTEVRLSWRGCTVQLEHETGTFTMNVPAAARMFAGERRIVGRFALAGALVGTAITLPPRATGGHE